MKVEKIDARTLAINHVNFGSLQVCIQMQIATDVIAWTTLFVTQTFCRNLPSPTSSARKTFLSRLLMWECFDVNFETAMWRDTKSMMNTDLYTLDI